MRKVDTSLRELTSYRLRRASMVVESEFNQIFADFGLRRTTFSVLSLIVDNPGLRQSDLAAALSIERPNIVQIIDELEAAKLAERHPAPNDRRAYALQPTAAGQRLFKQAMASARARDAVLTRDLTPEQLDLLLQALKTIETNTKTVEARDEFEVSRT